MEILYLLVPLALALAGGAVLSFRWAARNDQFDDLETPAVRLLFDDEETADDDEGDDGSGERDDSE